MKLLTSKNAALLLALLAMLGVQANGGPNGGGKKGSHDYRVRKEGRRVSIIAREKDGNRRGELFMQLSLNGFPRMRVSYRRKLLSNVTTTEEGGQDDESTGGQQVFSYRMGLLGVVETDSQSEVTQQSKKLSFKGTTQKWSQWTLDKDPDTNVITMFSKFQGTGEYSAFTANLTVEVSDLAQIVNGHSFDPNGLKFSLGLGNFPYSNVNNSIAFNMGLWTKSASKVGNNVDLNDADFLDFSVAKLKWTETVVADGAVVPVSLKEWDRSAKYEADNEDDDSQSKEESHSVLRFQVAATAPNSVLWDPEMTVAPEEADKLFDGTVKSAGEIRASLSTTTIFISLIVSIFIANLL